MAEKGGKKKVRARWVLRLDGKVDLKVRKGEGVTRGQILAVSRARNRGCFDMREVLLTMKKEALAALEKKWRGKKFLQGDVMGRTGRLFGRKILSPASGKFVDLDEFLNMCFDLGGGERKEILSPVEAVVVSVGGAKLALGFEALEFGGEVKSEGRVWGVGKLADISRAVDIDNDCEGKIVLSGEADKAFLAKAMAVGVTGLVTRDKAGDEFVGVDMPVLALNEKDFKRLVDVSVDGGERQMLLNCRAGRLLLVI